jgi:cob(I)alamin adenosyltransferase
MAINITTKRGDKGNTDILFGKSLPKTCPLFDLLNELDMIKVLLGKARMDQNISASQGQSFLQLQKTIVQFSGALCVHEEDWSKYKKSVLQKFKIAESNLVYTWTYKIGRPR